MGTPAPTPQPTPQPTPKPTPGATPAPTPAPAPTPGVEQEHVVEGTVDLEVANATAACADQSLSDAVLKSKAKLAKVPETAVEVTCVENNQRRLGSKGRRLAEKVSFNYKITVASAEEANGLVDTIDNMSTDDMAKGIQDEMPAGSAQIKVTGKTASAIVVTMTTTTTTAGEVEEPDDSHARNPAVIGSVAMAVIAATLALTQ